MVFSTVDRIRNESGFDGNDNVTDAVISEYLTQGNGVLLSFVASRYDITNFTASSDFTSSQAETMLKRCEELLSSGYLLIKEYGPEGLNTDKDGYKKVEEAMALLEMIANGKLKLLKNNGKEFALTDDTQAVTISAVGATADENIFSVEDTY